MLGHVHVFLIVRLLLDDYRKINQKIRVNMNFNSFILANNRFFSAKIVYISGLLVYSSGMCLMAITKHRIGVILFSWTAGVMYSTLFTMPYLLVAHYHAKGAVNLVFFFKILVKCFF